MPSVDHSTIQYENNRCQLSHQPSRQQKKQMPKFKSLGQASRFLVPIRLEIIYLELLVIYLKLHIIEFSVNANFLNGFGLVESKI